MQKRLLVVLMVALLALTLPVVSLAQDTVNIVFWSTEEQPERAAATQQIINRYMEATPGVNVSLVLTNEDALDSMVAANFAASNLPDVMFFPVEYAAVWYNDGILDGAAATQLINDLGVDNFSALNLVGDGMGGYVAVPTDGWGQILVYRKDLFDAAGLAAPTTFEAIEAAAAALNDPDNNFYGIVAATDPSAVFTQQSFEHFALANGARLTDDEGNVTLNTPEMVESIRFYTNLVSQYGPPGVVDVVSSRATYFAGQAAMIVWSPFILDEMAGLRDNALPNCPECIDNPAFLAEVSAIVPAFVGPNGTNPVQYGQVSLMGITVNADPQALDFVQFWLTEGYMDWLAVAAEGKFPMLRGTADSPTANIDGWRQLQIGVDRKAPIGDFYNEEVINTVVEGASAFDRWGFNENQGLLVGGVYQDLTIPRVLADVINGALTPEEAAEEIQAEVEELQASLAEQ